MGIQLIRRPSHASLQQVAHVLVIRRRSTREFLLWQVRFTMAATFSLFSPAELSFAQVPLVQPAGAALPGDEVPLRVDGRTPLEYRQIVLETDVSRAQGALGSAQVTVHDAAGAGGGAYTQVWAGVRGEVDTISSGQQGGRIIIGLEWYVLLSCSAYLPKQHYGAGASQAERRAPHECWTCVLAKGQSGSTQALSRYPVLPSLPYDTSHTAHRQRNPLSTRNCLSTSPRSSQPCSPLPPCRPRSCPNSSSSPMREPGPSTSTSSSSLPMVAT